MINVSSSFGISPPSTPLGISTARMKHVVLCTVVAGNAVAAGYTVHNQSAMQGDLQGYLQAKQMAVWQLKIPVVSTVPYTP